MIHIKRQHSNRTGQQKLIQRYLRSICILSQFKTVWTVHMLYHILPILICVTFCIWKIQWLSIFPFYPNILCMSCMLHFYHLSSLLWYLRWLFHVYMHLEKQFQQRLVFSRCIISLLGDQYWISHKEPNAFYWIFTPFTCMQFLLTHFCYILAPMS